MNPARRIHPMTYATCRKQSNRALKVHHRRDANAAIEVLPALFALGYEQGEQIIAQPPLEPSAPHPGQCLAVDRSGFRSGDLILQNTRPPLTDHNEGAMKQVERAQTDLEDDILAIWERVFSACDRRRVSLREELHPSLRQGYENHAAMQFCQRENGAPYTYLHSMRRGARREKQELHDRTAAFFLRVDEITPGGPGLVGAFGMDGIANVVWAWHLARDFAHLLSEPGFAIVELRIGDLPDRPTDLRWAATWTATEILRHAL